MDGWRSTEAELNTRRERKMKRKRHNWTYGCRECDGTGWREYYNELADSTRESVPAGAKKEKNADNLVGRSVAEKAQGDPIQSSSTRPKVCRHGQ
jgi:hypothetical protein